MNVFMYPANQASTCTPNSCNEPKGADFQNVWRQATAPANPVRLTWHSRPASPPANVASPFSQSPAPVDQNSLANPTAPTPVGLTWHSRPASPPANVASPSSESAAVDPNNFAKPVPYTPPPAPNTYAYSSSETAPRPYVDPYADYGSAKYGPDAGSCAAPDANCAGYGSNYGAMPSDDDFPAYPSEIAKYDPTRNYIDTEREFGISVGDLSKQGIDISIYELPPEEVTEGLKTEEDVTRKLHDLHDRGELTPELASQLRNYRDTLAVDPDPISEERNLEILNQLKSSFAGVPAKSGTAIEGMMEKFDEKVPEPGEAAGALMDLANAYAEIPKPERGAFFPTRPLQTYFEYAIIQMAGIADKLDKAGKLTPEDGSAIMAATANAKSMFGAKPDAEAMDLQLSKLELLVAELRGSGMQSVLMA